MQKNVSMYDAVKGLATVAFACVVLWSKPSIGWSNPVTCSKEVAKKNKILFLSNRPGGRQDKNWDLYETNVESNKTTRLTDITGVSIRWFDKDPVRNRVIVAGSSRGDLSVGPSGNDHGPADAEEIIAILKHGQKQPQILLDLRPNGHNPERFTSLWHPSFSPDGKRIVFAAAKHGESNNLWIMNDMGGALRRILPDPQRTQNDPRFAPNGKVVYVRHDKESISQILKPDLFDVWLIDPDRPTDNLRLTREDLIPGPALIETDPAVSPDCKQVAAIRSHEPFGLHTILRPFSSNSIMATNGNSSHFRNLQSGVKPGRTHGVPTWVDNRSLLSYRWEKNAKAWRVIYFTIDAADNSVDVLDLGAPHGRSDLMPLAY